MTARILIIEDNPANLELMRYLLAARGCEVLAAGDGMQGMDMIHEEIPDLVICDIRLPGIDGLELARRLRAGNRRTNIPLIAVTAFAMDEDRMRIMAAGFDACITKPIDPEAFTDEILDFIVSKS